MNVEFFAHGSPKTVSDAIEQFARAQGHVTALVVPWESTASTLRMAVTSVKTDGWAIEHTNLGTITLTAGGTGTRVTAERQTLDHESQERLGNVFDRFAHDVRQHLEAAPTGTRAM